ncbi:hypothetical protein LLB_2149 [Legionella longbeachae D-4968]|nr:hypothetical protein LLB_2149 [Legionella longbeachae D-4968]
MIHFDENNQFGWRKLTQNKRHKSRFSIFYLHKEVCMKCEKDLTIGK